MNNVYNLIIFHHVQNYKMKSIYINNILLKNVLKNVNIIFTFILRQIIIVLNKILAKKQKFIIIKI